MTSRIPLIFFLCLIPIAFGIQVMHFNPLLPQSIATHFGANGVANGWMDKTTYFEVMGGIMLFIMATTIGPGFFLRYLPIDMMNLPNKEFWLSPERRGETLGYIQSHTACITGAVCALLLYLNQKIFEANLSSPPVLSASTNYVLYLFIAATIIWTLLFYRRFQIPRDAL